MSLVDVLGLSESEAVELFVAFSDIDRMCELGCDDKTHEIYKTWGEGRPSAWLR
jgi:hypothetical protein